MAFRLIHWYKSWWISFHHLSLGHFMTLDDLIAKATALREKHGGQMQVGVWPYDGQMNWHHHFEDLDFLLYENVPVATRDRIPGTLDRVMVNMTFLKLEDSLDLGTEGKSTAATPEPAPSPPA